MKTYSCYFIDRSFRVLTHENVHCPDDGAAVSAASIMLSKRTCAGFEVWERGRCVAQVLRNPETGSVAV